MADGGAISVPAMMAIGGAVAGGAMDEENPLRGAALGAFGGYTGGAALGAAGAGAGSAAGLGGAAGSGVSGGLAGSAAGAGAAGAGSGMASLGGLGSGITGSTVAGGAAGGYGGMAALGAEGSGLLGGSVAPQLASAGAGMGGAGMSGLMNNPMAQKALSMGGQALMNQERQKQGAPVAQVAPPMMRPQFQPAPFMASAPSFRGVTGMPVGRFPMMNRRG